MEDFEKSSKLAKGIKHCTDEMCCFLAHLMHNELKTLRLPMLRCDELPQAGEQCLSGGHHDLAEVAPGHVQLLIEAIAHNCSSRLESLFIWASTKCRPVALSEGLAATLFHSFPRFKGLHELHLDGYQLNDWGLLQISNTATNLV